MIFKFLRLHQLWSSKIEDTIPVLYIIIVFRYKFILSFTYKPRDYNYLSLTTNFLIIMCTHWSLFSILSPLLMHDTKIAFFFLTVWLGSNLIIWFDLNNNDIIFWLGVYTWELILLKRKWGECLEMPES